MFTHETKNKSKLTSFFFYFVKKKVGKAHSKLTMGRHKNPKVTFSSMHRCARSQTRSVIGNY